MDIETAIAEIKVLRHRESQEIVIWNSGTNWVFFFGLTGNNVDDIHYEFEAAGDSLEEVVREMHRKVRESAYGKLKSRHEKANCPN